MSVLHSVIGGRHFLASMLVETIGRRVLERAFENSVRAIELRNRAASDLKNERIFT